MLLNYLHLCRLCRHLSNYTIYHHQKACAAKVGNPDLRFHGLRHTYATMRLEGGDDIKQASAALRIDVNTDMAISVPFVMFYLRDAFV